MKKILYGFIFVVVFYTLSFPKTIASEKNDNSENTSVKYECQLISRGEAISQAQRKVNGKVIGVKLRENGSRSVYRVRMLVDNKRIKNVSINACR